MQNSELYRQGVVLPLSDEAAHDLRHQRASEATSVEWIEFIDDQFSILWVHGVFKAINEACSTLIDEYEEDWVPHARMADFQRSISELLRKRTWSPKNLELLEKLAKLAEKAESTQRDILFVC